MAKYTPEDLRSLYDWAPEAVKNVIFAPETGEYYDKLAVEHRLTALQRAELSKQTGLLLLGVIQPTSYVRALSDFLKIPREQAVAIAQSVNREIFNPIKDALKEVHDLGAGTPSPYATPTGTAPVAPKVEAAPAADPELSRNILEQKLSSAFRIKSDRTNYSAIPAAGVPTPKLVVPPPPSTTVPRAVPPPLSPPALPRAPQVPPPQMPALRTPEAPPLPRMVPPKPPAP